jgi:hypothetical protein
MVPEELSKFKEYLKINNLFSWRAKLLSAALFLNNLRERKWRTISPSSEGTSSETKWMEDCVNINFLLITYVQFNTHFW